MSDNNTVHGIVTSGIVNFTSIGMILPVVKSFVILNFLLLSFEIVKHILCIKIYESQEKTDKIKDFRNKFPILLQFLFDL